MEKTKAHAGEAAAALVEDGMRIGLGTGSTVRYTLLALSRRIAAGLHVIGIPTSLQTERLAHQLGIPLTDFSATRRLDLDIDGADEIDPQLCLIKGGGGALLREKLVALASERVVIVADESKCVPVLGNFHLPIEIVPFAWQTTAERICHMGATCTLRQVAGTPFQTDNGNYLLDCDFGPIDTPQKLHEKLKLLPGVVETGLFCEIASMAIIGHEHGIRTMEK